MRRELRRAIGVDMEDFLFYHHCYLLNNNIIIEKELIKVKNKKRKRKDELDDDYDDNNNYGHEEVRYGTNNYMNNELVKVEGEHYNCMTRFLENVVDSNHVLEKVISFIMPSPFHEEFRIFFRKI